MTLIESCIYAIGRIYEYDSIVNNFCQRAAASSAATMLRPPGSSAGGGGW